MAIAQLIEQTIAQHIIAPKVLSYAPSKLNEVTGRFVSSNRVYNFVLNKSGVSYSPAGQGDSLLFSALYLQRLDAARKPKVGSDRCNAGKSYQCGKICLGNRRKCHKGVKDVNDARRIASILEGTNEKLKGSLEGSDKAKARGKALFEARKERVENPKVKPQTNDLKSLAPELFSQDSDKIIKDAVELNSQELKKGQKIKLLQYAPSSDFGNPRYAEQHAVTVAEVDPKFIKVKFTNAGGQVITNKHYLYSDGKWKDGTIHDGDSYPNAAMDLLQARKLANIKSPTANDKQKKSEMFFRVKDHVGKLGIKPDKASDDTDVLNRLEQLIELGKENRNTSTSPRPVPATKQQQEADFEKIKNSDTPDRKLAQKVVNHINNILTSNQQSGLPMGVKRHQGYLVADKDFYQAFRDTGGEWNSDARSAIRGSTLKSVIDQIKSNDRKYFSDKPEDNIILGDKTNRYMVVRRLKSGSLSSPRIA